MEDLELAPTAMAAGGDAIARDADGRVVFVEGALPGERVRAQVLSAKKDFARAVAVDILEPSPDRIAPPCAALAAGCGGCTWQHVRGETQQELKAQIVTDALRRLGRFEVGEFPRPKLRPPQTALRTTARLGVDAEGRAGQRRRGAHDIVATDACIAAHPRLEELVVDGRFLGATEVLLRVGVASGERAALAVPSGRRIVVPSDVVVGGHAVVHERIAGVTFQVSIGSFFQSGPVAAEELVAAVDTAVGDALATDGHLVDAYAGVGLFAATIGGSRGAHVTVLENDPAAIADARVNLAHLDADLVDDEVGRWRPRVGRRPIDVVVADPARSGLAKPGVAAVTAMGADRVVLVSCDPASLARDARLLADAGYRLRSIELVDAFPDTFHIEAVSRFDRFDG